ncbi:MAG TPA: DNA polymerase/3'-5' exonuclease PolX [Planctomycetaceae bacterium]|nr:DNA polymerase/3'-5' exonuclease PolX [Planctomycetaceae bacterium]
MSVSTQRFLWAGGLPYLDGLTEALRSAVPTIEAHECVGSFRRLCATVGNLDVLLKTVDPERLSRDLGACFGKERIRREKDGSLLLHGSVSGRASKQAIPFRLLASTPDFWGTALFFHTGPAGHLEEVVRRAACRGIAIAPGKFPACEETDIYAAAALPWIPPELRDIPDVCDWADNGSLTDRIRDLVGVNDLQGDLHMHTTWSDGSNSLEEMCTAARDRGLRYLVITDHTERVFVAGGLPEEQTLRQWDEIDALNNRLDGLTVLKGVECDVLENGDLDLSDHALARADWVVASLHFELDQPRGQITRRFLKAMEHPEVCVIGHPTGRIIGHHPGCDFDAETIFKAARETGTFLELNSNPRRLDLDDVHCRSARERGIPIVLSSDAHSADGLDVVRFGINQARRGALGKSDVVNTFSWEDVKKRSKKG